ncbi:hypothetical protein BSLG_005925 [Batrachochytrium salamandrivorans]|nr:hypothetical protein BSLG_005925 [Batrachochytrium salamandrivorans]
MADTPLPSSHVELSPLFEESDSSISYKVNISFRGWSSRAYQKSKLSVSFVEPLLSSHQSADAMIQDCHKANIDVPLSNPIDNISSSSDMILPAHDDHRNTAPISSPAPARFSTHAQLHQLKSQKLYLRIQQEPQ